MPKKKIKKEDFFVYYNSLVSINIISESGINRHSKYLLRMNNLEQTLLLKSCVEPLSEFNELKESLFFIREIEKHQTSDHYKKMQSKFHDYDNDFNSDKEEYAINKMNYNQQFVLQHLISKKFICVDKLPGNSNYILKLENNIESAVPFELKRIHETRTSKEFLNYKQSFYISIYIKEKDQYYYINSGSNISEKPVKYDIDSVLTTDSNPNYINNNNIIENINKNNNNKINMLLDRDNFSETNIQNYWELLIENKMNTKFLLINQTWYVKDKEKLFSSHVINIIFINSNLHKVNNKDNTSAEEEQLMLSAEILDNSNEEEIYDINEEPEDTNYEKNSETSNDFYFDKKIIKKNQIKKKKRNFISQQIKVNLIPYEKELYKHVMNNCFWVIEEELYNYKERPKKVPLKVGSQIKIKNVLLGLYLKVKKKGNSSQIKNNIDDSADNENYQKIEEEENEYEFELVDEETLIQNSFFVSNFKIFHYNMNEETEYMDFKGKFALRSVFKENYEDFDFDEMNKYLQPLSINIDVEKKYSLLMKNEDNYIFEIKKVDIFEASHVIFIKNLIQDLDSFLEEYKNDEIGINYAIKVILLNIFFLKNYLLNVEYILHDDNYDFNYPIEQRQIILEKYGILKIITKITQYLFPVIHEMNLRKEQIYQMKNYNLNGNNYEYNNQLSINELTNENINESFSENFGTNNSIIISAQKVMKSILEFLIFLSEDNEEIKEKIFLDLDIILELAEILFFPDRSILLNFIFKLIKNSEVLQDYVTGGKLNLMFTIKNSKGYKNYTEKEIQNKLIRIERILLYIETSNNYLFYYKRLLTLNKVKHKQEQIKRKINDHILKVEREHKIRYNYKRNLNDIIKNIKIIINRHEKYLIEKEKKDDLLEERKKILDYNYNKENSMFNNILKEEVKTNSESGCFLDNITNSVSLENKGQNKEESVFLSNSRVDILQKSNLKNGMYNKKEEKQNIWKDNPVKGMINIFKTIFGNEKEIENNIISDTSKNSSGEEKFGQKLDIKRKFKDIRLFLNFFENFDLNNILFSEEKYLNEIFNSIEEVKNSKSKLNYIMNGESSSIQLIDGIKLDKDSELGHLVPFNIFNKFFPKFQNEKNFFKKDNFMNVINEDINEDSENDLYNNKDNYMMDENIDYLEENKIFKDKINNNNKLLPKYTHISNLSNASFLQNYNNRIRAIKSNLQNNNNKNDLMRRTISSNYKNEILFGNNRNLYQYNNKIISSRTNPIEPSKIDLNKDELNYEMIQKNRENDLKKLNKYLCILYTTYQFCINQFYTTLYKILKIINNYYINYDSFCDLEIFKKNMKKIRETLISKFVFYNNDVLTNLYTAAIKNPTLLKGVFDIDKYLEELHGNDLQSYESNEKSYDYGGFNSGDEKQFGLFNNREKDKGIRELTPEEITLINSLFYFCNIYDKIKYLKDKVKYFRIIKDLIKVSPQYLRKTELKSSETLNSVKINKIMNLTQNDSLNNINNNNKSDLYIKEFINILEKLYKKKNKILSAYIDVNNLKKDIEELLKNQKEKNSKNSISLGYNINKRFKIISKLLIKYEIENLFGKLIYLDIDKNSIYFENNVLRNLKFIQNTFKEIQNEIRIIRIDYDRRGDNILQIIKDKNNNIINQINPNSSNYNKIHFQKVNSCLGRMTKKFLNFLSINSNNTNKFKDISVFNKILYKENENFYKKIGFDKTMENLIETIDCFYDFDNNPGVRLKYCQELLRLFLEIQSVYKNLKDIIPEYFKLYYNMIMRSLHTISLYQINKIGDEEEISFLKICYYSCESFMLIIINSEKNFGELRTFMINILSKLLKIYLKLKNPKNRVIFQILYTYYISRILLHISKEKYYDDFSYNSFFQIVYPIDKMHEQILSCLKEIVKEPDEEQSSEEENSQEIETYEENISEDENIFSKEQSNKDDPLLDNQVIIDTELPTNKNDFNFYHNNKYYNNYIRKKNALLRNKINNNFMLDEFNYKNMGSENIYKNKVHWVNEQEREKLSFYLNFLSIYVLYLHDRNSLKNIMDNSNKEDNINIFEYDFKNLYSKIENLLDNSYNISKAFLEQNKMSHLEEVTRNSNISNKILNDMNTFKLHFFKTQEEKIHKFKNNFQFESVLFESIILYKFRDKKQNVEISVKNKNSKYKISDSLTNSFGEKTSSISDKIAKLRNSNLITFYYYDNEYLDLIFLEKICNEIHLCDNVNYYCTNKSFGINDSFEEDLLQKILLMKKEFKLITSYSKGEYNLLHEQYINNDMEKFIQLLKSRFTNKDFDTIYSMKKFLYKRMNAIYSDDLYNSVFYRNKKVLSFVNQFKLVEKIKYHHESAYKNIDLYSYLTSLVYIYPKYPKNDCSLFYKIGFQLLSQRYRKKNIVRNSEDKFGSIYFNNNNDQGRRYSIRRTLNLSHSKIYTNEEKQYEYDEILEGLILIFSRKMNRTIIQENEVFFEMINSLILFLKEIKKNDIYIMKNISLIRRLLTELDFVFDFLFEDFEKIVNFMKSAENQKLKDKYKKNEMQLKIIIIFITTFLSLKKSGYKNLLTESVNEFIQNLSGQIIKLTLVLIETGKEDNMKTADILIDFIYYFIEDLDIDDLNSLFEYRFFNLVTYIITNIDYHKIFLNNLNRKNLHNIMDDYAKIEQKILKIFFVYYNVAYNNRKNIKEYLRIRKWYEENYIYIKNKLKKLYYFSKVEMEKRIFDIDKALLYKKVDDSYTDEELFQRAGILREKKISFEDKLNTIFNQDNEHEIQNNEELNNNPDYIRNSTNDIEINKDIKINNSQDNDMELLYNDKIYNNKSNYCLIKFDLIIVYYTLNLYYKDIINEEFFEVISPSDSFIGNVFYLFKKLFFFIKDVLFSIYYLINYLYRHVNEKAKAKVELLQELNNIDIDSQSLDEKAMFLDLSSKIKCVEISIEKILYKVYFPVINKAKKIEENTEYYLHVDNDELPDYISNLINNYDLIHISVTKNYYFDKLSELPIFKLIFGYINFFGLILIILGIGTNLVILLSYSDFTKDAECDCGDEPCKTDEEKRLYCPHFFFKENSDDKIIKKILKYCGLFQLIFQLMIIFDIFLRKFSINWALSHDNLKIKKSKKTNQTTNIEILFYEYAGIIISTIWKLFDFQFFYYIFYILFILLGYFKHPFFYCYSLLELVNRVEVMLSVIKAMYVPGRYILINLIMFLMLEDGFSFLALSLFPSHFPNIKDTRNFLKTFMRMLDQTFKQDGGIGTYLDQSLSPNYVPYTYKVYAGGRFFFDLLFYLCILLIIFQIFTSIIIDYFMNTRTNREDFTKKSKTQCLICGLQREDLEKLYLNVKDAFKKHTYYCHHIRNYINYLLYVQNLSYRDPIIEESIWNYHLDKKTVYLPHKTCFQLNERNILEYMKMKNKKEKNFNE